MHYILTDVLLMGNWSINGADGRATKPAILEDPTVSFDDALKFTRYVYISQRALKRSEKGMDRVDTTNSDVYYVYMGASSYDALSKLVDTIRDILIAAVVPEYTAFWVDSMEIVKEKGRWVANGIIRGELYGGIRSGKS